MRKLPQVLTEAEFKRLKEKVKNPKHKLAFDLAFGCGLRISEVVKLRQDDFDKETGQLFIRQAKGKKDRYVPVPKKLDKYFYLLPIGCTMRNLQIAFKRAVKRAEIKKDLHFHSLRHSCATNYLKKGWGLKYVQELLGHSDISTTGIYLHVTPGELKKKMDDTWG